MTRMYVVEMRHKTTGEITYFTTGFVCKPKLEDARLFRRRQDANYRAKHVSDWQHDPKVVAVNVTIEITEDRP